MVTRHRAALLCALALGVACSSGVKTRPGLVVVLSTNGALGADFDTVQLAVNGARVDAPITSLPTTLAIEGAEDAPVTVEARGLRGGLLRVATVKRTKVPRGHAAVLDVVLDLGCYDRCVQLPADGTVTAVCDPSAPAGSAAECAEPPFFSPDTLPNLDPAADLIADRKRTPTGCNATPFCASSRTCADSAGAGATGALACDASCRAVDDAKSTCASPGIAPTGWPLSGGSASGQRRSRLVGPRAPKATAIPFAPAGANGPPVVSADERYVYFTQVGDGLAGGAVMRVDLQDGTSARLTAPADADVTALVAPVNPVSIGGSLKCCSFQGAPVLAADGSLSAIASTGVLVTWANPTTAAAPSLGWVFKPYIQDQQTIAKANGYPTPMWSCFQAPGGCGRNGLVIANDRTYVGTGLGLVALAGDRSVLWGPVTKCASDAAIPAVAGDGRVAIGRASPSDGICVATPDGRARTFEGQDGVFGVVQGTAVGLDGTVYFGTSNYELHARSDTSAWRVSIDGPVYGAPAIGADGTVYVTTSFPNPALHAVDRLGRRKWHVPLRGATSLYASPLVGGDGTVYAANAGGFVIAVAPNGLRAWELGDGDPIVGPPVLLSGARLLTVHANHVDVLEEGP